MGYIRHDAIIVTSSSRQELEIARGVAEELRLRPTRIVVSGHNSYASFLIPPDGSKEGWAPSDDGDAARDAWKAWARETADTTCVEWVHVSYAGDSHEDTMVVDHHKAKDKRDD